MIGEHDVRPVLFWGPHVLRYHGEVLEVKTWKWVTPFLCMFPCRVLFRIVLLELLEEIPEPFFEGDLWINDTFNYLDIC